ncbi:MAG: Maf family nucleotide pyrophosphatase [Flavobacteriaceae bacterium]
MMLNDLLKDRRIILGSSSPRRQQFMELMGIPFQVRLNPVEEIYPSELQGHQISDYLAQLKADAFKSQLGEHEILITSDTVVWHRGKSLEKASDAEEAFQMLRTLSNDRHQVITSVCFTTPSGKKLVHESTEVRFRALSDKEIHHYVDVYNPYDKAGAYGIQEWVGLVGIEHIEGSYTNVVGLPTQLVYKTLLEILS